MKINSYPKVHNIGHPNISALFEGPVLIEEKLDGSQISFGDVDGLFIRSKRMDITNAQDKMFQPAAEIISGLSLIPGLFYRGEYLRKEKHNCLTYNRTPKNMIALFDISRGPDVYMSYEEKAEEAQRIGLEIVPRLAQREVHSLDEIKELMDTESFLGGPKVEGLVFKNYERWSRDGKPMMGKHVSEAFKEKHVKDWKNRNPSGKDVIMQMKREYCAEARWQKALQRLSEEGKLQQAPQDIGPLIAEIIQDLKTEEEDAIKERLFRWAWPAIARSSTRGFPQWYKERLAEGAFNDRG